MPRVVYIIICNFVILLLIAVFLFMGKQQLNELQKQVAYIKSLEQKIIDISKEIDFIKASSSYRDYSKNNENTSITNDIEPIPEIAETFPVKEKNKESTVEDLFGVNNNIADSRVQIDNIKMRYEGLLVIHFFLRRCEKADDSDYDLIFRALQKEAAPLNAPERLQYDVLTAAKGTYEELYSKTNCTESNVDSTYAQYKNYLKSLAEALE